MRSVNLYRVYRRLNRRYFNDRLPRRLSLVLIQGRARPSGELGCYVGEGGYCWHRHRGRRVRVDGPLIMLRVDGRSYADVMMTLLHEMCHVAVGAKQDLHDHGPRFQREMRRLARLGAFEGIW